MTAKFYVIWKGRKTGIFSTWADCEVLVKGFAGAKYKSFASREAAERALHGSYSKHVGKSASSGQWLFAPNPPIAESYCVDAACSGSPGPVEYRGVHTVSGKEFFHRGPFENGTNNVGEFLAIVQAVLWLQNKELTAPLYTDSATAIAWVKAKRCNTDLVSNKKNAPLFELINHAEDWLGENKVTIKILKWDTKAWGEIPADFNRK